MDNAFWIKELVQMGTLASVAYLAGLLVVMMQVTLQRLRARGTELESS